VRSSSLNTPRCLNDSLALAELHDRQCSPHDIGIISLAAESSKSTTLRAIQIHDSFGHTEASCDACGCLATFTITRRPLSVDPDIKSDRQLRTAI
jgi:hypothetical protein